MCAVGKWKTVAAMVAVAAATVGMATSAQAFPTGCAGYQGAAVNGITTSGGATGFGPFNAGDTITLTVTAATGG